MRMSGVKNWTYLEKALEYFLLAKWKILKIHLYRLKFRKLLSEILSLTARLILDVNFRQVFRFIFLLAKWNIK